MKKQIQIDPKEQIELAAEQFARILIEQVLSKKNLVVVQQIETKYDKRNK